MARKKIYEDTNRNEILDCLRYNISTLAIGETGFGKTEKFCQIAEEEGYTTHIILLQDILPEDISGIPDISNSSEEEGIKRRLLESFKAIENDCKEGKKVALFLDEITQASPFVLNTLYYLVKDKRIGTKYYPELRVFAATNFDEESPYLNELPKPLKERFYIFRWEANTAIASEYLKKKYNLDFSLKIESSNVGSEFNFQPTLNPRNVERGIQLFFAMKENNDIRQEKLMYFLGAENLQNLMRLTETKDNLDAYEKTLENIKEQLKEKGTVTVAMSNGIEFETNKPEVIAQFFKIECNDELRAILKEVLEAEKTFF